MGRVAVSLDSYSVSYGDHDDEPVTDSRQLAWLEGQRRWRAAQDKRREEIALAGLRRTVVRWLNMQDFGTPDPCFPRRRGR